MTLEIDGDLTLASVPGVPLVAPGDDVAALVAEAARRAEMALGPGDVVAVASKLLSRAEGRFVDLDAVEAGARAIEVAGITGHDPRLVEVILTESVAVSRMAPHVLITRHRLGHVSANAGVDASNARPPGAPGGRWILLLPTDPDGEARRLRAAWGVAGVIVTDSCGRPFRHGSVGLALGVSGVPALLDHRGGRDLFGRALEHTETALADQLAAAADLMAGQSSEGKGVTVIRGLRFPPDERGVAPLLRAPKGDLYA